MVPANCRNGEPSCYRLFYSIGPATEKAQSPADTNLFVELQEDTGFLILDWGLNGQVRACCLDNLVPYHAVPCTP